MARHISLPRFLFALAAVLLLGMMAVAEVGEVAYLGEASGSDLPGLGEGIRAIPMCDGETRLIVDVPGVSAGEPMPEPVAREVAGLLWKRYQEMQETSGEILLAHGKEHTQREMMIWDTELKRVVDEGYRLFHSPELGSNGVSCDMCHPDASNTHPETYPKFQTQLKKVILLRDMINWCIENPLEGPKLNEDDARMKALEAYILWARKGVPMEDGKH